MVQKIHLQVLIAVAALCFAFVVALPAFAHNDSVRGKTASSTAEVRKDKKKREANVNASCMQTAVAARETSLGTAFSDFHDDIEAGLSARKTALNTAWGLAAGTDRSKALRSAWEGWKKAHRDAFKTFREDRKSAWETFKKTVKSTCKETLPAEEKLGGDEAGTIAL